MEGGGRVNLDTQLFVEFPGDLRNENTTPFGYDSLWGPVKFPDMVQHQLGKFFCVHVLAAGYKMSHLYQLVNYREYTVVPIGNWEVGDHVIANIGPGSCWYWKGLQCSQWSLSRSLYPLTRITTIDVSVHKSFHGWPGERTSD